MSRSDSGPWGRDDLMVTAAFRYCLGRSTYIVGDCADWLIAMWPTIKENARNVIRRDLEDAFQADDKARADGSDYKPLGWDCDRRQWERVRALWANGDSTAPHPDPMTAHTESPT